MDVVASRCTTTARDTMVISLNFIEISYMVQFA